ncbi:MAG: type II secretion system GspH family protein [Phycisphaerales bacterium]|nr:type II secretion system GspH family protein [Phycisphaerales bacterium]
MSVQQLQAKSTRPRTAFSLVEVLVVISIIGLLVALTMTALSGANATDVNLRSRNNLRQIHTWMEAYSSNHRDRIVPSQFDYFDENGDEIGGVASRSGYTGAGSNDLEWVLSNNLLNASGDPRTDFVSQGTFADILWVESNLGSDVGLADFPLVRPNGGLNSGGNAVNVSYRYRAPDRHVYDYNENFKRNPLRSLGVNTFDFPRFVAGGGNVVVDPAQIGQNSGGQPLGLPKPFGAGAWEKGLPGFFAANNFFSAQSELDLDPGSNGSGIDRYVTTGQLKGPAQSMYLVDSFAGLTIGGDPTNEQATVDAFLTQDVNDIGIISGGSDSIDNSADATQEVDFRYSGGKACLMLFLDGHVELVSRFGSLAELQGIGDKPGRGIRVTDLDKRKSEVSP